MHENTLFQDDPERQAECLAGTHVGRQSRTQSLSPRTQQEGHRAFRAAARGPREKREALNTGVWCKPHLGA